MINKTLIITILTIGKVIMLKITEIDESAAIIGNLINLSGCQSLIEPITNPYLG